MAGFSHVRIVLLSPVKETFQMRLNLGKIIAHLCLRFFHSFRLLSGHSFDLYFKEYRIQVPNKQIKKGRGHLYVSVPTQR